MCDACGVRGGVECCFVGKMGEPLDAGVEICVEGWEEGAEGSEEGCCCCWGLLD